MLIGAHQELATKYRSYITCGIAGGSFGIIYARLISIGKTNKQTNKQRRLCELVFFRCEMRVVRVQTVLACVFIL